MTTGKLSASDEMIRLRTGRGWDEWFARLDGWRATELDRRVVARRIADELGVDPLVWAPQAVTTSYERTRGLREVGQQCDGGFAISVSKTVNLSVELLFEAFVDDERRAAWFPDAELRERTATRPKSVRFDWGSGRTRVNVAFLDKGRGKSAAVIEHARLANSVEAEEMRAFWRERMSDLHAAVDVLAAAPSQSPRSRSSRSAALTA